ncbi:MAG: nicotinamide-nucleotide adenylyltransferase, partial [Thermoplasmata archaeon]|nr:nicotinamide-nucleotide adenylyltransferase [Thermoplasmata archaeon]
GSSQASFTLDNPFTGGERFEMIERALLEAGISNYHPLPIPDIERHSVWVSHVVSLLPTFDRVYTNNPLTRELFERAGHAVEATPLFDRGRWEGTRVRSTMEEGGAWTELVPPSVARYLEEIHGPERLRTIRGHAPGSTDRRSS